MRIMIRIKHFLWLLIAILILQPVIADMNIVGDEGDVEIFHMQSAGSSPQKSVQSALDLLSDEKINVDHSIYGVMMHSSEQGESQVCCDDHHTSFGHCAMSCCFIPSNLILMNVLAHHGVPSEIVLLWFSQYPLVENRPPIA